ncbi:hypothetical protein DLH72_02760 [Candidatus Gracilibacteria bacterium]|nr:MAG: hypothetical protein DLH72_02760 [Candidatus Gracilibacteria bacterium]
MKKNIYKKLIILLFALFGFFTISQTYAFKWSDIFQIRHGGSSQDISDAPEIGCRGLPGCKSSSGTSPESFLANFIDKFIQVVAVLAVFALIFSGIIYMTSAGDEEKTNKAKRWIIWSLLGVFISMSAWGIILLLNNIRF